MAHPPVPMPGERLKCPLRGNRSLLAEHATWRISRVLRGRDFKDEASYQQFLVSQSNVLNMPLSNDASPADRAQELFYKSREAASWLEARTLRQKALALDPNNVNVLVDNAVLRRNDEAGSTRVGLLEAAVVLADAQVRADAACEAESSKSWRVLTCRPGLRARAALALEYVDQARLEDAAAVCQALLVRDPEDVLGARHQLVALQLELGHYDEARELLDEYAGERGGILAWARLLLALLTGAEAEEALSAALRQNKRAEGLLLAPELIATPLAESYVLGSLEEAEIIGDLQWRVWRAHPAPLPWLRAHGRDRGLHEVPTAPVWERMLWLDEDGLRGGIKPYLLPLEDAVLRRLKELIVADYDERDRHVPENAVSLLAQIGAAADAVPELITCLLKKPDATSLEESQVLGVLARIGRTVAAPALRAYAEARDPALRAELAMVLARSGERSDDIFAVLAREFDARTPYGSLLFCEYGDPAALPLLFRRLDQTPCEPVDFSEGAIDLIEAIQELGGTLSEEQELRFAKAVKRSAHWRTPEGREELKDTLRRALEADWADAEDAAESRHSHDAARRGLLDFDSRLDGGSLAEPVAARRSRPGRNAPCWCGSGQKYKRCHLKNDESEAN